jgi:uracil-DNA glycosylase family 4
MAAASPWDRLNRNIVACERCPRLREYCRLVGAEKRRAFADWDYWAKPVPNFGPALSPGQPRASLLIVGLAPAAHGANRTGRMFTGDRSGQWLYRALHKAGFANQPTFERPDDGLALQGCAITAICHCAPPDNRPTTDEIANCRTWLTQTIDLAEPQVVLALGQLAWQAVLGEVYARAWLTGKRPKFAHGVKVALAENRWLLGSYHPSQQNTFTGVLTEAMFDAVFAQCQQLIDSGRRLPTGE